NADRIEFPRRKDITPERWNNDEKECDISLAIPENEEESTIISKISLSPSEYAVPLFIWPFSFYLNGTLVISPRLDYEKEKEHSITIEIYKKKSHIGRFCNIRVEVIDIDEKIHFVNSPRPFYAVVPTEPPIGLHIYKLEARYEDPLIQFPSIQYHLINQEPDGFFSVDSLSGIVRTKKREYKRGEKYRLFVEAVAETVDRNKMIKKISKGNVAVVEISSYDRPPQFLKGIYEVEVAEDTQVDTSIVQMKAVSFRSVDGKIKESIHYSIKDWKDSGGYFRINPSSGIVHLERSLDYDNNSINKLHRLSVIAQEGNVSSTVQLNIMITDVNDNRPIFKQPFYSALVPEDFPLGKTIIRVEAIDLDSGENGRIIYSINNSIFDVNENGDIYAKSRIDADVSREETSIYRLIVNGRDNGVPPLSSTTIVQIRAENRNDEYPIFLPTSSYISYVAEDAKEGTPIIEIQAKDIDGDQILYSLLDENGVDSSHTKLFVIDKDTGVIRLGPNVNGERLQKEGSPLNITVIATDDGGCCEIGQDEQRVFHRSEAIVRIAIEDINNNKPVFVNCEEYSKKAKLKEGHYKDGKKIEIIQVIAEDNDTSSNGQIIYSLYHSQSESRKAFVIDSLSGIISPSPHIVFDRESRQREDVTVKATDNGDRPLIAFCSFSIEIEDVNDNAPLFDRDSYTASIWRYTNEGTNILTVVATDLDAPQNGRITYSLGVDSTAGIDHIDDINYLNLLSPHSGQIILAKKIDQSKKTEFRFIVIANDNGEGGSLSSSSTVNIVIHNNNQDSPQWMNSDECPSKVIVKENMGMNMIIARCVAATTAGTTMYKMSVSGESEGGKASKFRHFTRRHEGDEWMDISIMEPLDYEISHNYTITLIATDMSSYISSSRQLIVEVEDENDSIPHFNLNLFTGNIQENITSHEYEIQNNGMPIVRVHASDADGIGPKSEVFYRILCLQEDDDGSKFRIDSKTGEIYPLVILDREMKDELIITVEARDNWKSSLPGMDSFNTDTTKVRILIDDINDNAPVFEYEEYTSSVKENSPIGHILMTLKATDRDKNSKLRYEIANNDHSTRLLFGIETETGIVFVKDKLDYENEVKHSLKVIAIDGIFNTTTQLIVLIEDVNDCAPQFTQSKYEITINEEDANIPQVLLRVMATDKDKNETNGGIVYDLIGQGVGEHFSIHSHTGEMWMIKSVDRDPPKGLPTWMMIVRAIDSDGNGLIGYADVQINVRDVNDNPPYFSSNLFGFIDENREPQSSEGIFIMRVEGNDIDDPNTNNGRLTYSIIKNKEMNGNPIFTIDSSSGKIFATMSFDYEGSGDNQMVITVMATDHGIPQLSTEANVTIFVRDKNDFEPYFEQKYYSGKVKENAPIHTAILTLSAMDEDKNDPENILTYSLAEQNSFFYMTSEEDSSGSSVGVIRVKELLDYEKWNEKEGMSMEVIVSDGIHEGKTTAYIHLIDENDGHPIIEGMNEISISEGLPTGSILTSFTVHDQDYGDSARFRINRQTDPKRQFTIDQDGVLKTANILDREDIPKYALLIEAFDNAGNVGSQMVAVYLMDENDNGPIPYTMPDPCIFMENLPVEAQQPCEIRAIDRDTQEFGPPFKMELDSAKWKYSQYLNVTFDQNGDGGNGSMSVVPIVVLDREAPFPGKVLEVPLILWDKAGKMNQHSVYIIVGDE
ncbi:hmr-1, partial [Pristionchus pacificus]|uniref:Hmr-1 n=1 Tax=Pristionchus pacificus TaxID=54126 RepID=A0A2A6BDJ8_PRIPA